MTRPTPIRLLVLFVALAAVGTGCGEDEPKGTPDDEFIEAAAENVEGLCYGLQQWEIADALGVQNTRASVSRAAAKRAVAATFVQYYDDIVRAEIMQDPRGKSRERLIESLAFGCRIAMGDVRAVVQ